MILQQLNTMPCDGYTSGGVDHAAEYKRFLNLMTHRLGKMHAQTDFLVELINEQLVTTEDKKQFGTAMAYGAIDVIRVMLRDFDRDILNEMLLSRNLKLQTDPAPKLQEQVTEGYKLRLVVNNIGISTPAA